MQKVMELLPRWSRLTPDQFEALRRFVEEKDNLEKEEPGKGQITKNELRAVLNQALTPATPTTPTTPGPSASKSPLRSSERLRQKSEVEVLPPQFSPTVKVIPITPRKGISAQQLSSGIQSALATTTPLPPESTPPASMPPLNWKEMYFNLLAENEKKQREWTESQDKLKEASAVLTERICSISATERASSARQAEAESRAQKAEEALEKMKEEKENESRLHWQANQQLVKYMRHTEESAKEADEYKKRAVLLQAKVDELQEEIKRRDKKPDADPKPFVSSVTGGVDERNKDLEEREADYQRRLKKLEEDEARYARRRSGSPDLRMTQAYTTRLGNQIAETQLGLHFNELSEPPTVDSFIDALLDVESILDVEFEFDESLFDNV